VRERAGSHGGLLQTGVDIACRLGQFAPCRHFDVGAVLHGSIDRARRDDHYSAVGPDDTAAEHDPEWVHDAAAAGQHDATEVSATWLRATWRAFGDDP